MHCSATCVVYTAKDVTEPEFIVDEKGHKVLAGRVALKIMESSEQFERELAVRGLTVNQDDSRGKVQTLNAEHVVSVLRSHDEENAANARGGGTGRQRCLVMPAAERSLEHIISAERIAGVDRDAIKRFGADIGSALQYLHDQKLVHADFKPRNIVRTSDGDYKLIDFDAAVKVLSSLSSALPPTPPP